MSPFLYRLAGSRPAVKGGVGEGSSVGTDGFLIVEIDQLPRSATLFCKEDLAALRQEGRLTPTRTQRVGRAANR